MTPDPTLVQPAYVVEGDAAHSQSRILILDDDEVYLHLCKRYLRADQAADHTIVSAKSIQEALQAIRMNSFDCMVVDYCLPDGTGTDAIEKFRAQDKN